MNKWKNTSFLHHDEYCNVALFMRLLRNCYHTVTKMLLPFHDAFLPCPSLHKSLECGSRMPPETLLSVSVVYGCYSIPVVIRIPILCLDWKWDHSSSKTSCMLYWICWWGWCQILSASLQWWCVSEELQTDLYLAGDVLLFWGWHCLGFSSGRFLKMLFHRCFQVHLPNLRVFFPHCDQRITRLPEWSSGHLAPCCNGIIWYLLNWVEWCGTAAICKGRRSLHPGRANSGLFSIHTR